MITMRNGSFKCNKCGEEYEICFPNLDRLNNINYTCKCGGKFIYCSVEERYADLGLYWCSKCEVYLPGVHPEHNEME